LKAISVSHLSLSPTDAIKGIIEAAHRHEQYRLNGCINLVASQNRISPTALQFLGSSFAAKFTSGELGHRAHGGAKWLDHMEEIVADLAGRLFSPYHAELRPLSGSIANETLLMAFTKPGDTIIAPSALAGGHASVRPEGFAGFMGLRVVDLPYIDGGMTVDLDALEMMAVRENPRAIVMGTAKILFPYPVGDVVQIADRVGAKVIYDGAHVAGLIAGKQFQDPLADGAIAFTGSTQKTFPGPIGGLIVSRDEIIAERVRHVTRSRLDNYQNSRVAAMGVVFAEMLAFGQTLASRIVKTAQHLGAALDAQGLDVVGMHMGYTRSHMILLDTTRRGPAATFRKKLEELGIFTTATDIWSDDGAPHTGLRLGANDIARLSFAEKSVVDLASIIADVIMNRRDARSLREDVVLLSKVHPRIDESFLL